MQRHDKVTALNENYVTQEKKKQERARRRKQGLLRRLTVFGVLVVIMFTVMIATLTSQAAQIAEKKEEKQAVEQRLEEVKAEKAQLSDEVNKLQDPDYIGEVARRDYNMSKPGETIFKLPDNKEESR
ncbi:FtsB family cell division protein [Pseudalkalibacillus salsuginis]|uniref:FtsB family cell division protein n=1 Tax=Pseudalkalibacillus salsuginis TaxID=2910972 RepID=UPI001F397EA8|nr:septum formation initiator family protein [Pseudalkalibacillus salsuginis]MCF6411910.1 septum formation initiator family protein [Pseudalkalibacillus salsuginis]